MSTNDEQSMDLGRAMTTTSTTHLVIQEPESIQQPEPSICISQQAVLQITLNGPSLILTLLIIILSIQILQPPLASILLVLAPLPWIIHNDYVNFISLGPGGTPSTFLGYVKIACLRLFALSDPYTPEIVKEKIYPETGYYQRAHSWLPQRNGPRPKIAGIAPQRQLDQPGCRHVYQMLRASIENVAVRYPDIFSVGTSCFEKKGLALFAQEPINRTCRGEICHVHHSDRSMHLSLHPDDAKMVLEKGWGERHPLARGGWMKQYVPREFVMIYAPRDHSELDVVCRIIEAAGFWVSGQQMEVKVEDNPVLKKES